MAAGDVIAYGAQATGTSFNNYQPAAGVEILLTSFGCQPGRMSFAEIYSTDGATFYGAIAVAPAATPPLVFKLFINNSVYFSYYNGSGSNAQWSISGIQLK